MVPKGSVNSQIPELNNPDTYFESLCPPLKNLRSGLMVTRNLEHAFPYVVKAWSGKLGAFVFFLGNSISC